MTFQGGRISPRQWLLASVAVVLVALPLWAQMMPGSWNVTASLNQARGGHAAAPLPNGQALIVGGTDTNGHALASAEVYNASTDAFTLLSGSLTTATSGLTATALSNGTALVAGGTDDSGNALATVQIFDPTTTAFATAPSLSTPRSHHTATLLADGTVLIVGGTDGTNVLGSIEIFNPSTRTIAVAASQLAHPRKDHTASLLADGRVLIAGGADSSGPLATAELYNPADGSVTPAGSLVTARTMAAASRLVDDTVIVEGGQDANSAALNSAEIYDPAANAFAAVTAPMVTARASHLGVTLPNNGRVLIAGGTASGQPVGATEVYDPLTGTFIAMGQLNTARSGFGANAFVLPMVGRLLASGGFDSTGTALSSTEMFSFPTIVSDQPDYPPGSTATITGAGWTPNEPVSVDIHESDNDADTVLGETADATGTFTDTFQILDNDGGVTFLMTATGATSNWTAQNKFTDASNKVGSVTLGAQTPNPVTAGNSATYAVTVNRGSGPGSSGAFSATLSVTTVLPTGASASFSPNPVSFLSGDTSKGATLTISTSNTTPAGSSAFTVQAANVGDAADKQSTSGSLVVGKQNQTITFGTPAPASAAYNTSFNVAASASSGLDVTITVSGVCSITGGGTNSATIKMTAGIGTCSVMGNQPGNSAYNAAPQVTETVTAQKADQTISFTTPAPASAAYNSSFAVAASATSGLDVAITVSGVCSITSGGTNSATIKMTSGTGTCSVMANQGGDSNYNAAPEVTGSTTAQKADQTISFITPPPATAVYNTSFAVAASASSGLDVAITVSGVCSITSGGTNSATIKMTSGTGTCTVMADQVGDSNYNAAPEVTGSTTAQKADQTISFTTPPPATAVYNTSFNVAASATSTLNVAITVSGVCSITGGGTNSATIKMTSGTGTCTVMADQAGDSNYNAAPQVTGSTTAKKADQTINFTIDAPATAVYNTSFTVAATATSSLAVTFSSSGVCSNVGATYTMTSGTGVCTVKADQAGDSNYNPAPEVTESTTALKANQTISFTKAPPPTANFGDSFPVIAVASSSLPVTIGVSGVCQETSGGVGSATVQMTAGSGTCDVSGDEAGDLNYNPAPEVTLATTAEPAPLTATVTVTCSNTASTPCQYSDPVTLTATLSPDKILGVSPALANTTVDFYISGTSPAPPLKLGTATSADLADGSGQLTWTLPNVALLDTWPAQGYGAPGSHSVTAVFNNLNPDFSLAAADNQAGSVTIVQEDGAATYTGALYASTSSPTSTSATVTLAATIQDASALSHADPRYDAYPGDIRNARVTFINRDTNTNISGCANLPVGLVNLGDTTVGTATCQWTVNITCSNSPCWQTYTIGTVVSGYYADNASNENTVVNVSQPGSNFITGGGYLDVTSSAGQVAGAVGTKNNFGFNVKFNKNLTNLQGNINTIVRSTVLPPMSCPQTPGIHVYQVKGNSMTSLSVQTNQTGGNATFNGKASIQDITNPAAPCSVDGNATLQAQMTDMGTPGTNDLIGVTVWNKSGGLWFSSNWTGTNTSQKNLGGGNLSVH